MYGFKKNRGWKCMKFVLKYMHDLIDESSIDEWNKTRHWVLSTKPWWFCINENVELRNTACSFYGEQMVILLVSNIIQSSVFQIKKHDNYADSGVSLKNSDGQIGRVKWLTILFWTIEKILAYFFFLINRFTRFYK